MIDQAFDFEISDDWEILVIFQNSNVVRIFSVMALDFRSNTFWISSENLFRGYWCWWNAIFYWVVERFPNDQCEDVDDQVRYRALCIIIIILIARRTGCLPTFFENTFSSGPNRSKNEVVNRIANSHSGYVTFAFVVCIHFLDCLLTRTEMSRILLLFNSACILVNPIEIT